MPETEKPRADRVGSVYPLASEESHGLTQGLIATTLTGNPYPIKGWIVYGQNIFESIPVAAEDAGGDQEPRLHGSG